MPSFEDNLNFIFNANYKHGSDFWIAKIDCINTISILKSKISKITAIIQTINHIHGEQLINKSLKNLYNLEKVLKKFEKKTTKAPQKIAFANKEANKLLEESKRAQNTNADLELKSSILVDKIKFLYTELSTIKVILNLMKKEFDTIEIRNDHIELPLDSLCDKIKKCLKETEEYNILKLKHAQEKFEQSKELNDFMYGKRNPKLAHLLSLDDAAPTSKEIRYELKTPFGSIWVQRGDKGDRIIYNNRLTSKAPNYDELCNELDFNFNPDYIPPVYIRANYTKTNYISDSIKGIIEPIIKYINQPLTKEQNNIGTKTAQNPMELFSRVKSNFTTFKYLTLTQKEAAAFLCGVLLLSESHDQRNPTGGKFERKAMKNVLRLVKNGCINPFSVVFNRAKGRYIPAHDQNSLRKFTNGTKRATTGGLKQTQRVLNEHSIPMEALFSKSGQTVSEYWKGQINRYLQFNKLSTTLKKPISKSNQTRSTKAITPDDIINDLKEDDSPIPIYLTDNYYNDINEQSLKPKITKSIISDLKKLVYFSKMDDDSTIDINDIPTSIGEEIMVEIKRNKKLINKLMNNSLK